MKDHPDCVRRYRMREEQFKKSDEAEVKTQAHIRDSSQKHHDHHTKMKNFKRLSNPIKQHMRSTRRRQTHLKTSSLKVRLSGTELKKPPSSPKVSVKPQETAGDTVSNIASKE